MPTLKLLLVYEDAPPTRVSATGFDRLIVGFAFLGWLIGGNPVTTMSSTSTAYVKLQVTAIKAGVPVNPTGDVVQMAFMANGAVPGTSDWKAASWETTPDKTYIARCLVGPGTGGVVLAQGTYEVWVKVTDAPEVPVIDAGPLTITP